MHTAHLNSPIGILRCTFSEDALQNVHLLLEEKQVIQAEYPASVGPWMSELEQYFCGTVQKFSFQHQLVGTPFQRTVWQFLSTIPYAEVVTYSDVAQAIGKPKAVRAVGTAVGSNPLPIVIPCHRVIGKNGIGGYHYGLPIKKWLLEHEQRKKGK